MAAKSPMLAERDSLHTFKDELRLPVYATPKLDGIRCVISGGTAMSRKFIPIKNDHIRTVLSDPILEGLDGELIVGAVNAEDVFNKTTSAVMGNKVKEPQFEFHVFDDFTDPDLPYARRQELLHARYEKLVAEDILFETILNYVYPMIIPSWEHLDMYEQSVLAEGYEGVITRHPDAPYKFGRSSRKQQGMLKLKRFTDSEAEIIGFEELMHNENEDVRDALGHAKRSKKQEGMVAGGTLGKLRARDLTTGVEFQIGMFKGLTLADKQEIWNKQADYLGRIVKYSHFSHGAIDLPRHSKFLGFRDKADM